MKRLLPRAAVFSLAVGCSQPLRLPEEPVRMTIVQRTAAAVPGSNEQVFVHLGDITGGQVLLEMRGSGGKQVLNLRSVRKGDVIPFELGSETYSLSVVELRNFTTDDFAVLEISSSRPESDRSE